MKTLSILMSLLAVVSVLGHSELLRGGYHERALRNDGGGGECDNDGDCKKGSCSGDDQAAGIQGTCHCNDGWSGDFCDEERCGSIDDGCDHGKCKRDECDCDEGWTGDACDDEIDYHLRLVAVAMNPNTVRDPDACADDLDDFMRKMGRWSDDDLLDIRNRVVPIAVPSGCGDSDSDTATALERIVRNNNPHRILKSTHHSHSGDDDDDEEPVLTAAVFRSLGSIADADACLDECEKAAKKMEDWKANKLEKLKDTIVYIDPDECDAKTIEQKFKDEM
mmetsp:Transcript_5822/g.9962  ORF Transcript_5822/g.9962 Transcript_5822/m.9962 type:complete len:278 (-) Transcript_5822:147-980(-)|eukprot:CAMPEP_0201872518 /NCGR_PEP_ID=MMETSP0902-20130614/5214_1 /ASSEMBLY_ACC=CAM_ASM_000551 /TAXON_ID=420261 /ORGANISM="Thalassiosira antarctica, Strain CCMP982" /LENGTH=277 /DNA_ID=CAMNT_0048398823 /DNA_START=65 /DNA_END=898 /DNA_ORIENTATION=-